MSRTCLARVCSAPAFSSQGRDTRMDPVALWQRAAAPGLYLSAVAMRRLQLVSPTLAFALMGLLPFLMLCVCPNLLGLGTGLPPPPSAFKLFPGKAEGEDDLEVNSHFCFLSGSLLALREVTMLGMVTAT